MAWITHTSQHTSQVTQQRQLCFPSKIILICHYLGVKLLLWYFWISAAFDTIDHSTLLSCLLDWFGVGGSILVLLHVILELDWKRTDYDVRDKNKPLSLQDTM